MNRPAGVTILGVLAIVGGVFALLIGLLFLVGSGFLAQHMAPLPLIFAGLATIGGVFLILLAVFDLVLGIGLLKLANWARLVTMVFAAIGLVFAALGTLGAMVHFFPFLMMRRAVSGVIDALILWYLSQPHVKQAFLHALPNAPTYPGTAPGAPPAAT
jgi:hypothetical protein